MLTLESRDATKKWLADHWVYLIAFVFFLYVGARVPFFGDDWEISTLYSEDFLITFLGKIKSWKWVNGRLFNNLADAMLGFHHTLWIPVSAFVHTGTIYFIAKAFKFVKNKLAVGVSFLMLLSVSSSIRREVQLHIVGNVSYTICIFLIFLYYDIVLREGSAEEIKLWDSRRLNGISVALLSLCASLWIENLTLGFLALNLVLCAQSLRGRKSIPPNLAWGSAANVFGVAILFSSRGVSRRIQEGASGRDVFHTAIDNFKPVLNGLVNENLALFLVFAVFLLAFLVFGRNRIKNRTIRILSISCLSLLVATAALGWMLQTLIIAGIHPFAALQRRLMDLFFNLRNTSLLPLAVSLGFLAAVGSAVALLREHKGMIALFAMAFVSVAPMVLSPGARNLMLALYVLIAITGLLASKLVFRSRDARRLATALVFFFVLVRMDNYSVVLEKNRETAKMRDDLLKAYKNKLSQSMKVKEEWLILPSYTNDLFPSANPGLDDFHMGSLKKFYAIPKDAKVIIDDKFLITGFSAQKTTESSYRLMVAQVDTGRSYSYEFYAAEDHGDPYKIGESQDGVLEYSFEKAGHYRISCTLLAEDGTRKTVNLDQAVIAGE